MVSSYFWEHIPPEIKPGILKECQRILKPGGKLIFLYDVKTRKPADPRKFKKRIFLNFTKSCSLMATAIWAIRRLTPTQQIYGGEHAGFRCAQTHRNMEKPWFQSPSAYEKLARVSIAHSTKSLLTWAFAGLGRQPFFYPYTAFMRLVDRHYSVSFAPCQLVENFHLSCRPEARLRVVAHLQGTGP